MLENLNETELCFVGALLGCACGDSLGVAVEMQTREQILEKYPGLLRELTASSRGEAGCYSDDTEMTLALARSILRCADVEGADCARSYAAALTPERGYGRSALRILTRLGQGADWRLTGREFFPEGSFGNGAAMRIAPLGLLYGHQSLVDLQARVHNAVWMTHSHPEALDAALLQARAISWFLRSDGRVESEPLLAELRELRPESILNRKLAEVAALLDRRAGPEEVVKTFGCGVRSADSWPPALWAALHYQQDAEEAIVQAVNLGGDTDTVGAMTGSLVGALHGAGSLPKRWLCCLENGPGGRDELITVACRLARLFGS